MTTVSGTAQHEKKNVSGEKNPFRFHYLDRGKCALQRVAYFFLLSIATKLFTFGRPDEAADGAGDESEFAYEQANPGRPMTTDAVAAVFFLL